MIVFKENDNSLNAIVAAALTPANWAHVVQDSLATAEYRRLAGSTASMTQIGVKFPSRESQQKAAVRGSGLIARPPSIPKHVWIARFPAFFVIDVLSIAFL